MAKLHPKPYTFKSAITGFGMDAMNAQQVELARLEAVSVNLPDGEVKGGIVDFHVADGKALYLVTSEKPLTLQHLDFFDGYAIPAAHLRGLDKTDVLQKIRQAKHWRKLMDTPRAATGTPPVASI